jgi:hypothetical protein
MSLQSNNRRRQLMSPLIESPYVSFLMTEKRFRVLPFCFRTELTNKQNNMKNYILPLVLFITLLSCVEENVQPVDLSGQRQRCDPADRKGCFCKDGTRTTSIDQNSCADFGGFERYVCKNE